MEPRAQRHQLREQLSRARAALDRGDRDHALAAVARALELDPDYLAAQALRDRIDRLPADVPAAEAAPVPPARALRAAPHDATERWAGFEQRARLRRIEKRAASARDAMASLRLVAARAAIDEIRALDPTHPDLIPLGREFDAATCRATTSPTRLGPALIAMAVFAAFVLGVRMPAPVAPVQQRAPAVADHAGTAAPPRPDTVRAAQGAGPVSTDHVAPPSTSTVLPPASPASDRLPVSTFGTAMPTSLSRAPGPGRPQPEPAEPASSSGDRPEPAPQIAPVEPTNPAQLPGALLTPPPAARARPVERTGDVVSASRPVAVAPVVIPPAVRDEDLVLRTLQQYRRAYDTLDARAAQAVWPGVDGAALQRAFDGLVSQRLTFRSCQLQVNGPRASAVCRGTAQYTPRMGSRDARDEPRNWRFALRKTANDEWQIESALVVR